MLNRGFLGNFIVAYGCRTRQSLNQESEYPPRGAPYVHRRHPRLTVTAAALPAYRMNIIGDYALFLRNGSLRRVISIMCKSSGYRFGFCQHLKTDFHLQPGHFGLRASALSLRLRLRLALALDLVACKEWS